MTFSELLQGEQHASNLNTICIMHEALIPVRMLSGIQNPRG